MVYRNISADLKEAAIRLYQRGRDNVYDISVITGMSIPTFYRALRRKRATGSAGNQNSVGRGRPRKLLRQDCIYLLRLARYKPTLFLDEYARRLEEWRALSASLSTIHRSFERAGINVKHVQKLALERDPVARADFVRRIGEYPPHYLISIDEVSKDDRTYTRLWGRSSIGTRVEQHDPFVRKRRYSMIGALVLDEGIIAARVLEGSFRHNTFYEYLRDDVVRVLQVCLHHKYLHFPFSSLLRHPILVQKVFFCSTMPGFITQRRLQPLFIATAAGLNIFPLIPLISSQLRWHSLLSKHTSNGKDYPSQHMVPITMNYTRRHRKSHRR